MPRDLVCKGSLGAVAVTLTRTDHERPGLVGVWDDHRLGTYDAYQTDGQPTLVQSVVLFLDLLGTSDPRSEAEARAHLEATHEALEQARDWGDSDPSDETSVVRWFSDNLGMAYPVTAGLPAGDALTGLTRNAGAHQLALIGHEFIARGAISLDLFYADEHLLYGPALNWAVALEKTRAIYPRVVLDETATRVARTCLVDEYGSGADAPQRRDLAVDEQGVTFVHYLATGLAYNEEETPLSLEYLAKHQRFIATKLAEHDRAPHVHDKYRWLAAYHDWYVESLGETASESLLVRCARPLAASFRPFGSDVPVPEAADPG